MREAIGGALLIKLVMFFIAIYVCVLSVAINYSITFRVKNQIITLIEEYEGYDNASDVIDRYIKTVGYYRTDNFGGVAYSSSNCPNGQGNNYQNGYSICKIDAQGPGGTGTKTYYKVTTYVSFSFPVVGLIANFPVTGETRVIYKKGT